MKKFKIYAIQAFILLALLPGCNDFIDLEPKDALSMDIALTSLENLEGAILSVYERGRFPYSSLDYSLYKLFYTDIIKPGTHIMDQRVWNEMCTLANFDATNDGIEALWDGYYAGLNRANTIIEKIDLVEYNRENPDAVRRRNTVLGEAYFFRAYFHLNLVEYWDNIVLADQVFDNPSQAYVLATKDDVYALIVSDLEQAIDLLPEASDLTNRGRVSKGAARHLLSLAYMDLENWTEAAAIAEDVISDPAYDFVALDQVFNELNQNNNEIIFSWQFIPGATDADGRNWTACQLIPLYDRVNGVARTFEQGGRPWSRNVPNDYYFSLFEEDDLRLEAWHKRYWIYDIDIPDDPLPGDTIVEAGDPPVRDTVMRTFTIDGVEVEKPFYLFAVIGDTVTEATLVDVAGLGILAIMPTTTKYWEYDGLGRTIDDAGGFKNVIQFRYAEAFLIAAEAYLQSGTNLARGQELFDELRARAGQAPIDLTLDNLLDEQARELGFEGRRYPMLKRLGILLERVEAHNPELNANIMPFNIRWPLPKTFVDLTGVPQNEGYE